MFTRDVLNAHLAEAARDVLEGYSSTIGAHADGAYLEDTAGVEDRAWVGNTVPRGG